LGETTEGDSCTIFRVAATQVSSGHLSLRGNALIVGSHWADETVPKMRKAVVGFTHVDEWAYQKLIQQSTGATKDTYNLVLPMDARTLLYIQDAPPIKELVLAAGVQAKFERTRIAFTNRNHFLLEFTEALNLAAVNDVIRNVGNLLSLLIGEAVQPIKVRLTVDENLHPANRYADYFLGLKTRSVNMKSEYEMPLPFAMVGEAGITTLFNNWFLREQELGPVYDLLLSTVYEPNQYVQSAFLSLTQGLESFHRRLYEGAYVPKEDYEATRKALVNAIPSVTDSKLAEKIKSMLSWGNEYSLRDRLQQLLESLDEESRSPLIDWAEPAAFVRTVAQVRNYLTHYKNSAKPAAIDSLLAMYNINQRLRALLTVLLLKHLGADEKVVAKGLALRLNLGH